MFRNLCLNPVLKLRKIEPVLGPGNNPRMKGPYPGFVRRVCRSLCSYKTILQPSSSLIYEQGCLFLFLSAEQDLFYNQAYYIINNPSQIVDFIIINNNRNVYLIHEWYQNVRVCLYSKFHPYWSGATSCTTFTSKCKRTHALTALDESNSYEFQWPHNVKVIVKYYLYNKKYVLLITPISKLLIY